MLALPLPIGLGNAFLP